MSVLANDYKETIIGYLNGEKLETTDKERLDWAGYEAVIRLYQSARVADKEEIEKAIGQIIKEHLDWGLIATALRLAYWLNIDIASDVNGIDEAGISGERKAEVLREKRLYLKARDQGHLRLPPQAEIQIIFNTGVVDGVTVKDGFWRRMLLFDQDPEKPSLVSTVMALNALHDLNDGYARDFLKNNCFACVKATEVRSGKSIQRTGPFVDVFIQEHWDRDTGAFRYHKDAAPSIYGTSWAVQSFSWAWDVLYPKSKESHPPLVHLLDSLRPGNGTEEPYNLATYEKASKLLRYVGESLWQSGEMIAFAEMRGGEPAVTTTHGAVQLLRAVLDTGEQTEAKKIYSGLIKNVKIPDKLQDIAALANGLLAFVKACAKSGIKEGQGLANKPTDVLPDIDATYYGFSILSTLGKILGNSDRKKERLLVEEIDKVRVSHKEKGRAFIGACRRNGYFARFEENENASCIATDLALQALWGMYEPETGSMEVAKTARYDGLLGTLEKNVGAGALGFAAHSHQNIFALRSMASIIQSLSRLTEGQTDKQNRLSGLKATLKEKIFEHNLEGTPLFTVYRQAAYVKRK